MKKSADHKRSKKIYISTKTSFVNRLLIPYKVASTSIFKENNLSTLGKILWGPSYSTISRPIVQIQDMTRNLPLLYFVSTIG